MGRFLQAVFVVFSCASQLCIATQRLHHTRSTGRREEHVVQYAHMVAQASDVFPEPKRAAWVYFVTVAPGNKNYITWTFASIQSLVSSHTKYDIVVLVEGDAEKAEHALLKLGVTRVIRVSDYVAKIKLDLAKFHEWNKVSEDQFYHAWNKLLAWSLTEYNKAVVIDSDVFAWRNTDELMLYPELAATQDTVWPLQHEWYTEYFNSGVMVIRPNGETFERLIAGLATYKRPDPFWWDTSEQTYLNMFFNNSWYHLSPAFNYVAMQLAPPLKYGFLQDNVRLVHQLKESKNVMPREKEACAKEWWVSCVPCCERVVHYRNVAFGRLRESGVDTADFTPRVRHRTILQRLWPY